MKRYFLDTSALVKIYHREDGSEYCLARYVDQSPLIISELARVELHSAIFRKQRERELSATAMLLRKWMTMIFQFSILSIAFCMGR